MSDAEPTPAIHDIGGLSRFRCSAVERDEAPPDAFGKRVDALRQVLAAKKLMTVDELRRGIEFDPRGRIFRADLLRALDDLDLHADGREGRDRGGGRG